MTPLFYAVKRFFYALCFFLLFLIVSVNYKLFAQAYDYIYTDRFVQDTIEHAAWADKDKSKTIAEKALLDYSNVEQIKIDKQILIEAIHVFPNPDYYFDLGNCLYFLKQYGEAVKAFFMAAKLNYSQVYYAYYNAACAASLNKERDKALDYFELAVSYNYADFNLFRTDSDLAFIRSSPRFEEIIANRDNMLLKRLTGSWMLAPVACATCLASYGFYTDGRYMCWEDPKPGDGLPKEYGHQGKWEIEDGRLIIYIYEKTMGEGSKMGPNGEPVFTKSYTIELQSPEIRSISLSPFYYKECPAHRKQRLSIKINNIHYWNTKF